MKTTPMNAERARNTLRDCGVEIGGNFFVLPQSTVSRLLEYADLDKYRAPKNANGSRGRYYHDRLQRIVARCEAP